MESKDEKVRVLIVEDEIIIADNIADSLGSFGYEVMEPVRSYKEAVESNEANPPSIAILDIRLAGTKTGIDLGEYIQDNYDFPFIFLTSNSDVDTLQEAKLVEPNAFLVKPFGKEELYAAIELGLYSNVQKRKSGGQESPLENKAFFVRQKSHFERVNYQDILYIQSDGVYLDIYTADAKPITIRGALNDYIHKLNDTFLRCHRSYIINLDHLEKVNQHSAIVAGVEIPIGKKYRQEVLSRITLG